MDYPTADVLVVTLRSQRVCDCLSNAAEAQGVSVGALVEAIIEKCADLDLLKNATNPAPLVPEVWGEPGQDPQMPNRSQMKEPEDTSKCQIDTCEQAI